MNTELINKKNRKEINMSIYTKFIEYARTSHNFKVDFKNKSLKCGNSYLIKNGRYDLNDDLIFLSSQFKTQREAIEHCLNTIEILYNAYKYSNPSKETESFRDRSYFKALPEEELTIAQRVTGDPRDIAKARLEAFILCTSLAGYLVWDDEIMGGHWFYQGNDKDLIIMREWIDVK